MIFPVETDPHVRNAPLLPKSTHFGPVHIVVTDRAKALAIWRDVVGLALIAETPTELHLGVGDKVLIVLETGAFDDPHGSAAAAIDLLKNSWRREGE